MKERHSRGARSAQAVGPRKGICKGKLCNHDSKAKWLKLGQGSMETKQLHQLYKDCQLLPPHLPRVPGLRPPPGLPGKDRSCQQQIMLVGNTPQGLLIQPRGESEGCPHDPEPLGSALRTTMDLAGSPHQHSEEQLEFLGGERAVGSGSVLVP